MKNKNGIEKSATLKGQTLVNLFRINQEKENGGAVCGYKDGKLQFIFGDSWTYSYTSGINILQDCSPLVKGKKYYYRLELSRTPSTQVAINSHNTTTHTHIYVYASYNTAGSNQTLFTGTFIANEHDRVGVYVVDEKNGETITGTFMVLEYIEGMENWNISYFEGMSSVVAPKFKTCGRNLFDFNNYFTYGDGVVLSGVAITINEDNSIVANGTATDDIYMFSENILDLLQDGETYTKHSSIGTQITFYDGTRDWQNTFTVDKSKMKSIMIYAEFKKDKVYNDSVYYYQINQGSIEMPYEPYKSNTLTVNEDITLRKLGNMQDTLDLVTGELTQCVGELVLDGSQTYVIPTGDNFNTIQRFRTTIPNIKNANVICDKLPVKTTSLGDDERLFVASVGENGQLYFNLLKTKATNIDELKIYLSQNPITIQYELATPTIKTVNLSIQDQDNQPQERMKLFPNGYINTSSATFPPILELEGITHNNKLNMTTTNGTNNTQLTTLDNLALDGIICRDGTVVRDSYDVESGLYTKRVFRFTVDEEFVERYRNGWNFSSNAICFEYALGQTKTGFPKSTDAATGIANNVIYNTGGDVNRACVNAGATLYIRLLKEELKSYDVDGLLDWIKRNGTIEVAYQMATPQIIHMQPNMTPYVSTRPYQGEINSQGNALESSFLDYTQEESILSPKPLGEGDVLRWEQGSQCYVYENDKDYIPLTDYNQKVGTVLDLEDDEQFVENLDGGEIVVDVPFKEKAVYERELISYEDTVIYPTMDKLDPDGKVEVDYICGATWQNPDDLSDIQHLGALREDGQYDVTIRRSGDDEIRFMNGTTHIGLDGDGLNPSEFELTFFNSSGVEVGKYGDTSHMLENTLVDGRLETGMVYGETMVNLLNPNGLKGSTHTVEDNIVTINGNGANYTLEVTFPKIATEPNKVYTLCNCSLTDNTTSAGGNYLVTYRVTEFNGTTYKREKQINNGSMVITIGAETTNVVVSFFVRSANGEAKFTMPMLVEGDYTSYPMPIPYFEGVSSTVVHGFTTTGKNLFGFNDKYEIKNTLTKHKILDMNSIVVSPDTTNLTWINAGFYNYYLPHKKTDYFIISRKEEVINGNPYDSLNLYDADDDVQIIRVDVWEHDGYKYDLVQFQKDGERANIRFYCGSNTKNGIIKYSDIQITKYSQRPSRVNEEFEPYHSIQYTLPTPITLNKVGDVADTYDVVSGVETRNFKKVILDGSENWNVSGYTSSTTGHSTIFSFSDNYVTFPNGNNGTVHNYVLYSNGFTNMGGQSYGSEDFKGENGINRCNIFNGHIFVHIDNSQLETVDVDGFKKYLQQKPLTIIVDIKTQTIQHTLIPSTVEMMQEPTFILPQPLRSVPNGICDRLYWDENKGHYCIEKRVEQYTIDGSDDEQWILHRNSSVNYPYYQGLSGLLKVQNTGANYSSIYIDNFKSLNGISSIDVSSSTVDGAALAYTNLYIRFNANRYPSIVNVASFKTYFNANPMNLYYPLATPQIIDLPHLNRKLELPTCPDKLPVGYKAVHPKMNPQIGLTIPYKQLNPPSQPQNLDFQMNKEDYVLTWNDVKEARQYNVILNDNIVATTKVPWYNTGEEIHGYILVEAQNEIADNLSKELYVKTVPKAPAQLTVAHNGLTDNYDFEISFIKSTSSLADRYTVQYRVDGGEWIIQDIPANEVDANVKVLWKFSVFEIKNQIEVWATATNDMGTNDILPLSTYYMTPTPQWTYRINSREVFLRWVDESPYDTQYKLRYQYKSDGIYRYAHFEGDKEEIGQLYEAVVALAEDDEVTLELCVISDRENLYCKPIKASKALDPNILPPKNFNYRWLSRGLIEFYWEDVYDVDLEYEAIVEHRLSGETTWIEDRRVFSATDTEGTGTVYRLQYQMEDLEEIRVKVRMKWAMNETEWSESLTTVFIPVEGNPPQWIRRTQTQEGLLVEWEAQEYIDSYHVYVKGDGVELQHLETRDNFIYVDIDYSNPIDIEIYEVSRFTGGIEAEPSDSMRFIPHQNKQQMINNIYHPDTLKYELEVNTVQKAQKASYQINDINTTPDVRTREAMDVSISSPFIITYHPLEVDVHQKGVKSYGVAETHIKTLDVKTRETVEVLTFERITDKYGMDFTVYTPFASKYPVNLEINQVRIVCLGDSLTSGHPLYWAESGTGDVTASYPYQLAKRLKNQYEVINKGYGSDTTDRCLARFDKDVLAYSPQYCLYQCGTNDLYWAMSESMGDQDALDRKLQVMKENSMEIVKRCWDAGIIPIVGTLIPRTGATGIYKTALYDFNKWVISYCTEQAALGKDIFYVDFFNAGKDLVPAEPLEDPNNPGALNPELDGDRIIDEFGNIVKEGRGIHCNARGYWVMASAVPLSIFKTYDSGLRMYKDVQCTVEDEYDDSDKQNPFYTLKVDNVRRSKTKTVVRYVKNIGKTQVLFAIYGSDFYNMKLEFIGANDEKGEYANGLLAPNMVAKITMEINIENKDSKASFNLHLASREYKQS